MALRHALRGITEASKDSARLYFLPLTACAKALREAAMELQPKAQHQVMPTALIRRR